MATEMVKEATPQSAGYVQRGSNYAAKKARMEQEEREIEEMMSQQRKAANPEEETEEEVEEEVEETTEEVVEETEGEADEELEAEERSFKKRYGDLRRHMADKEKEWGNKLKELEARLDGGPNLRAPAADEDIEAWATKHPEIAAIVETIAVKKAEEKFASADERLRKLDEAKYEADRVSAETIIRKSHDDFDDLRNSDKFHGWVEEQPKWVQDALYENEDDPKSVVRVIDLYKADNGLTKTAKKTKAKAAAADVGKGTRTKVDADDTAKQVLESEVAKMDDAQFEENYERILEAQRTGKFVYDISGRAR